MYCSLSLANCRVPCGIPEFGSLMSPPCSFQALEADHISEGESQIAFLVFQLSSAWPQCSLLGHNYTEFAVLSRKLLQSALCDKSGAELIPIKHLGKAVWALPSAQEKR